MDETLVYCFGQIKPEYRGNLLLNLGRGKAGAPNYEDTIVLQSVPLNEIAGVNFLTEGIPLPGRRYIGVNERAQEELSRNRIYSRLEDLFFFDRKLVDERIVKEVESSLSRSFA